MERRWRQGLCHWPAVQALGLGPAAVSAFCLLGPHTRTSLLPVVWVGIARAGFPRRGISPGAPKKSELRVIFFVLNRSYDTQPVIGNHAGTSAGSRGNGSSPS